MRMLPIKMKAANVLGTIISFEEVDLPSEDVKPKEDKETAISAEHLRSHS